MDSRVFDDIYEKAKNVVDVTAKKTNDIVEISKLKFEVSKVNRELSARYEELGRNVYLMKKSENMDDDLISYICDEIDELKDTLTEINELIADKKNIMICCDCGAKNTKGSIFCSKCGSKLKKVTASSCECGCDECADTDNDIDIEVEVAGNGTEAND